MIDRSHRVGKKGDDYCRPIMLRLAKGLLLGKAVRDFQGCSDDNHRCDDNRRNDDNHRCDDNRRSDDNHRRDDNHHSDRRHNQSSNILTLNAQEWNAWQKSWTEK
nr:hypothetical protein BaRGS_019602 [Batillaria attramentaria]